jgi:hypothetical protein
MAGDCPDFAESAEQNGTVPLSEAILLDALEREPQRTPRAQRIQHNDSSYAELCDRPLCPSCSWWFKLGKIQPTAESVAARALARRIDR